MRNFVRKKTIRIDLKKINVDGLEWSTEYTILCAIDIEKCIAAIFDYMEFPKHGVVRNLFGFSRDGKKLWVAENPTTQSNDAYTFFLKHENELWVCNFAGSPCQIDPNTGKLIEAVFTK